MKVQRDKLQQYQKKLSVVAAQETEIARECLRRGDKKKALVALRRKKYQETLLDNTDRQLEQLEILVNDVEFARVQKDVLYGLRQGTTVLKMMQKEMGGVEGVERLLGETEEAQAYTKVRLRNKWKWLGRISDLGVVGGERDACRPYVKPRGGRSRGRINGTGTASQWRQRGASSASRGTTGCTSGGLTATERVAEGEVGEEAERARRSIISVLTDETNWDKATLVE